MTDVEAGLVERETELELIAQLLGSARKGVGRIALFEADNGLGKSRLVTAAAAAAEATGMEVLRARGRELERGFPFGLATQLLEQHWDGPRSDGVAAMLADRRWRAPSRAASDGEYGAGQIYAAIHRLFGLVKDLSARAGAPALAVIVDDLHHADTLSLRFLAYLAARISDLRLALILITGTNVPAGDEPILSALPAAAGAAVLRPGALTAVGVASVVRSRVPDADGGLCELYAALTQGNPLLVTELLDELSRAEAGVATPTSQLVRDLSPDSWRRIVSLRLARLTPEAAAVAQAL